MADKNKKQLPPQGPAGEKVTVATLRSEGFAGPLPPPEMLARYNDAFPGCAERIVAMAESQAKHRQDIERKAVYSKAMSERIGQILGFLVAVASIGSGVYLTMHDKPTQGLTAIMTPVIGLVAAFIYGKRAQRKELEKKDITVR